MWFESTDPLSSRDRFTSRAFFNKVVITGMFIVAVCVWSLFSSFAFRGSFIAMLFGDIVALLGAYYLCIVWERRPIPMRCPRCGEIVLSSTPWFCTVCEKANTNATEFPFVYQCEHCGTEPKAYKCHHRKDEKWCGEVIFLSKDRDATNYAYRLNAPDEMPEPDEHAERLKDLREKKETKQADLDLAQVEKDLITVRKRIRNEKGEKKSAKAILQAGVDEAMELEDAEFELRTFYKERFKSDPAVLKRMLAALKAKFAKQKADGM